MSDQTIVQELLIKLESEGRGDYFTKNFNSELEYRCNMYGDCIYFEFDKDGKLLDISA